MSLYHVDPCICDGPTCSRCANQTADIWYLAADRCAHPEPSQDLEPEFWDVWVDDHPWSNTPDVGHVCLLTPIPMDVEVGFYVTIKRGKRSGFLLGPYLSHGDALENVDRARRTAEKIDSWAGFDAFGVALVVAKPERSLPPGKLNGRIGLKQAPSVG
jgi:hypothetical protein